MTAEPVVDPFQAGWEFGESLPPLTAAAAAGIARMAGPVDVSALTATLDGQPEGEAAA